MPERRGPTRDDDRVSDCFIRSQLVVSRPEIGDAQCAPVHCQTGIGVRTGISDLPHAFLKRFLWRSG